MNCERCGRNVPIRSKVCPNCGKANPNYVPQQETVYERPAAQRVNTGSTTTQTQAPKATTQTQPAAGNNSAAPKKVSLKTVIIIAVIVIAAIVLFKQCGVFQLRGTWEASDGSSITFSDSKNGYITSGHQSVNFTYFVEGDEVEIKTANSIYSYSQVIRYRFSVSGNKLTLTDLDSGMKEIFYKK